MPDFSFFDKTVTKNEVLSYKETVGKDSAYTEINRYHRDLIIKQLAHHLIKINYLVHNQKSIPNIDQMYDLISDADFIRKQDDNYKNDRLYVLSTAFFYLFDLKPTSFYDEIKAFESLFVE